MPHLTLIRIRQKRFSMNIALTSEEPFYLASETCSTNSLQEMGGVRLERGRERILECEG
uniref:Uncharacterized protein n=1 Tax=Nelumbo nucifera TaxID=4432 RepID=A0A822XDH1_NELNU|nr:TPA_asm: hypothetical protein HUJ06_020946 [Nelumbo nucifera]